MNRMGLLLAILSIGVSSDSAQIPRGNDSRGRVGVLPFFEEGTGAWATLAPLAAWSS